MRKKKIPGMFVLLLVRNEAFYNNTFLSKEILTKRLSDMVTEVFEGSVIRKGYSKRERCG